MKSNEKYWVWLNSSIGLGSKRCMQLIRKFGDPKAVWNLPKSELESVTFIPKQTIQQLLMNKSMLDIHMEALYKNSIRVITIEAEAYPIFLKKIHDPPIVLYCKGVLQNEEKAVAVVGSRKASPYGLKTAETISRELSKCGVTVISGMARGIDSHAHQGALNASGRTIAVLGCGLDTVYPPENEKLMRRIIESGACLSEYVPGVRPLAQNFPARNRIISGISMGVVVIEANEKSGSLITADFALEQGREVFAVPGNVSSLTSRGTNKLIKDGAKIVTSIEDILEEIAVFRNYKLDGFTPKIIQNENLYKDLDLDEKNVIENLYLEPLHIDKLAEITGMGIQVVNAIVIMLELKGMIEQLPGKIFKLRE